jgi:hypothetical protein
MAGGRIVLYAMYYWWPESLAEENVGVQCLILLNKMLHLCILGATQVS